MIRIVILILGIVPDGMFASGGGKTPMKLLLGAHRHLAWMPLALPLLAAMDRDAIAIAIAMDSGVAIAIAMDRVAIAIAIAMDSAMDSGVRNGTSLLLLLLLDRSHCATTQWRQ
jgi:hypothetical protein